MLVLARLLRVGLRARISFRVRVRVIVSGVSVLVLARLLEPLLTLTLNRALALTLLTLTLAPALALARLLEPLWVRLGLLHAEARGGEQRGRLEGAVFGDHHLRLGVDLA